MRRTRRLLGGVGVVFRAFSFAVRFAGRPIRVHPTARVSWRSVIRTNGGGSISIGAYCEIHDFAMILTYGGDITLAEHCSVNPFSIVYGHGGVKIERGVRIAAHTVIVPANHVRGTDEAFSYTQPVTARGIHIRDGAWIGSGCRILDGVTIGRHAIIGAGSVVTRSVPDDITAVGNPARPLERSASTGH